jgi:hypothetical protein
VFHHSAPSLQRYGKLWVYHFHKQHHLTLRCTKADSQIPHTLSLEGSGFLRNLSGCHISSPELQDFPELRGTTNTNIDPPKIFLPDKISVLNDQERQQLKDVSPPNLQRLDELYTRVTESRHTYELDSFLQAHQASLYRERQTNCFIIPLTLFATLAINIILGYFFYTRFQNIYCVTHKAEALRILPHRQSNPVLHAMKTQNKRFTLQHTRFYQRTDTELERSITRRRDKTVAKSADTMNFSERYDASQTWVDQVHVAISTAA